MPPHFRYDPPQAAAANLAVALVRQKPSATSGCPANVSSLAGSSKVTAGCSASGASASVWVEMGDVCTEERSMLYLWVAVKGAQEVRIRRSYM